VPFAVVGIILFIALAGGFGPIIAGVILIPLTGRTLGMVFFRLIAILPASGPGKPLSYKEAWATTNGSYWDMALLSIIISAPYAKPIDFSSLIIFENTGVLLFGQ
jgi:hypothetical protein